MIYESNKLDVFTRNRVNNIRSKVNLSQLHWVEGKQNLSDTGTRPDAVDEQTIHPNSEWITGKQWMRTSYKESISAGIIRRAEDIRLDHESKKKLKDGLAEDIGYEKEVKGFLVRESKASAEKIVQCEAESNYLYPPLKYGFRRTIRTTAIILLAVKKFKLLGLKARARFGEDIEAKTKELEHDIKFRYFHNAESEETPRERFRVYGLVTSSADPKEKQLLSLKRRYFALTEEDLSRSLDYMFKKASEEVTRYSDRAKLDEIAVRIDNVLYLKSRILEHQTLKAVGGLEDIVDVKAFPGLNFRVPLLYRYSPLSLLIASHLHYEVFEHKGLESCYRLSLNYVYILQGRAVFREIIEDCIKCKVLRKRYLDVEMGSLHDAQLTISPVFYCTLVDCFGPLKCYCPGYERATRTSDRSYKVWMMVMCCVATGCVNVQLIETQDTDGIMTGFNRFFCEETVPKIVFPDNGSSLLKALQEMEGQTLNMEYRLAEERGITFRACLPQGHSAHGRVERIIRSLQDSLEAANVKAERLTATGWQTVAKAVQNSYNNLPLGSYYRRGQENVSILGILTPNLLKGKISNRSPAGLFEVEREIGKLLERTQDTYRAWYSLWNTIYLPQLLLRSKWHQSSDNLREDDIVLFKLKESSISVEWVLGKVDQVKMGRDGVVRECVILYKSVGETDRMILVERPVREVIKLFNIEDTTLLEDIERTRNLCQAILKERDEIPSSDKDTKQFCNHNFHKLPNLPSGELIPSDQYVQQVRELNLLYGRISVQGCCPASSGNEQENLEDDPLYFV